MSPFYECLTVIKARNHDFQPLQNKPNGDPLFGSCKIVVLVRVQNTYFKKGLAPVALVSSGRVNDFRLCPPGAFAENKFGGRPRKRVMTRKDRRSGKRFAEGRCTTVFSLELTTTSNEKKTRWILGEFEGRWAVEV